MAEGRVAAAGSVVPQCVKTDGRVVAAGGVKERQITNGRVLQAGSVRVQS